METAQQNVVLILASSSARRRELLEQAGFRFRAVAPPIPEPEQAVAHLPPARQAEALAYFKACSVAVLHPESLVLGADTVVAAGDKVLGKPSDADDARRMLRTLSGTRHCVITGMALLKDGVARLICSDVTYVTMRPLTDDDVEGYIASMEWEDKAGAYAIQETADRFVTSVEGSFSNVVGLPMEMLRRMLAELREHGGAHNIP